MQNQFDMDFHTPKKELAGRLVLFTWDNTLWTIMHEVHGKYVIESMNKKEVTKVEKSEVILINN